MENNQTAQNPNAKPVPWFRMVKQTIKDHLYDLDAVIQEKRAAGEPISKEMSEYRADASALRQWYAFGQKLRKQKENAKSENIPLMVFPDAWKNDIALFAKEALSIELYDHQKEFCNSNKRINIMIAGRGAGKSVAARVKALHDALCYPCQTVLVVSSALRMSCDFGSRLLDLARESAVHEMAESITQEEIVFKNHSAIKLLPANPDTIRGYHPQTGSDENGMTVILDEACFIENGDDIRKAVEYAMITTPKEKGRLLIVSSPSSMASWVFGYVQKAESDASGIAVFNCASSANPNISTDEIERLKATKNEIEYRAEVLGEWTDSAYGLFSGLIEPHQTDYDNKNLPNNTTYSLGADLALSFSPAHDRNAIALMAKIWPDNRELEEPTYLLMDVIALDQASDNEVRCTVKNLVDKYHPQNIAIEQYQGKALAEYCQTDLKVETQLVCPSSGLQQSIFHEMHRLLKQGHLILPADLPELFFSEMKAFEYRSDQNGHVSFGHPSSGKFHDDTVYAAAWALHAAMQIGKPYEEPFDFPPMILFVPRR